jgi:hypothetical protein
MSEELVRDDGQSNDNAEKETGLSRLGRRALMLSAASGAGAAVCLIAGADPASAQDTAVELGETNTATATTQINTSYGDGLKAQTTQNGQTGVYGIDASQTGGQGVIGSSTEGNGVVGQSTDGYGVSGSSQANYGVYGYSYYSSGVYGTSATETGVYGTSKYGYGVYAESGESNALYATASNGVETVFAADETAGAGGGTAVYGTSLNGTGVAGNSLSGTGVSGTITGNSSGMSGVYGEDASGGGGAGVQGVSYRGTGVLGTVSGDTAGVRAVYGVDQTSQGGSYAVVGTSALGVGVYAESASATALQVEGVATFSRSGVASVAAGKTSITVSDVTLSLSSMVLVTPQGRAAGVSVEGVVTNPRESSFKIYLTAAPTAELDVAWLVLG